MDNQKSKLEAQIHEALEIMSQIFPELVTGQSQDIKAFREQASKISQKAEKNRDLAIEFLHDAKIDLHACKKLHQQKLYAPSVYHLQQAAEKANKAWALGFGTIQRQELREVQHKTPLALISMLKQDKIEPLILLIKKMEPSFTTDIEPALRLIKRPSHPDIAKMTSAQIESYLPQIQIIDNMAAYIDNTIAKAISSLDKKIKTPQFGQLICVGMSLYILGVITFPHEAYTRYSDGDAKAGELLPKNYDSNLGIVQSLPKLEKLLSSKIKLLIDLLTQSA